MSIAVDLATALDPVLLARRAGIEPDSWQAEVLRSTAPRILLNCSRQSGKSTIVAALAMHEALYHAGALILMLSPGMRQSGELFKKATTIYRALGRPVPAEIENRLELELENGSRIVALPGNETTIRSYSGVRLLLVDEASRVSDELYYSIRPMLAVSGGRMMAPSTPFGKRGWWHQAWTSQDGWEKVEVPASMCPRIEPEFLEEERQELGHWWYAQEYECRFMDTVDSVFSSDDIDAAFASDVQPFGFVPLAAREAS